METDKAMDGTMDGIADEAKEAHTMCKVSYAKA